jgi:hypothetical protein
LPDPPALVRQGEFRFARDEKSILVLKSQRVPAMIQDMESRIQRHEERVQADRASLQRLEELARALQTAVDEAEAKSAEAERKAQLAHKSAAMQVRACGGRRPNAGGMLAGRQSERLQAMEQDLKSSRSQADNAQHDLARAEEEVKALKRKLERAATAASAASTGGQVVPGGMDEMRLQAMELALRCPVYKNQWKDCIIVRGAPSSSSVLAHARAADKVRPHVFEAGAARQPGAEEPEMCVASAPPGLCAHPAAAAQAPPVECCTPRTIF